MKKIVLLLFFIVSICLNVSAQKDLSIQGAKIKDGVLYLEFDKKSTLEYFTTNKIRNSRRAVDESKVFSLSEEPYCNVYLNWLNPLKYNLIWSDKIQVDERDRVVNEFVSQLIAPFGATVSSLGSSASKELIEKSSVPNLPTGSTEIIIPDQGFNSVDLTLLYIQLRTSQDDLSQDDRDSINILTAKLSKIDKDVVEDIPSKVDDIFQKLLGIEDYSNVTATVSSEESEINKYKNICDGIENEQEEVLKILSKLKLDDALLNSYYKSTVMKFISENSLTVSNNREIIKKIEPIFSILRNSIVDQSSEPNTQGFFRVKKVKFDEGEVLNSNFTISEFEYDENKYEYSKKAELINKNLVFQKYDFFAISVSTGVFYSNTTLAGFGVSNGSDNDFIVVEDDIEKSSPVAAAFLNFNAGVGSRYFAPLIQLGIDPTKKRPFLLFGGGFSIPSAKIAFTGGGVWTWNQSLNKLSVGEVIQSTVDLESDISYKFDVKPKGWYLGIQYNF